PGPAPRRRPTWNHPRRRVVRRRCPPWPGCAAAPHPTTVTLTWKRRLGTMHGGVDFRQGASPVEVTSALPSPVAENVAVAAVPLEPLVRWRAASLLDAGSVHS